MPLFRPSVRRADRDFLFKLIGALLVYSLVPLGEVFFFLHLADLIGGYLVLAAAALIGPAGALLCYRQLSLLVSTVRARRPGAGVAVDEIAELAGLAAAGVLLLTPGFLTDLAGFILLAPPVRRAAGRAAARFFRGRAPEVLERLGLGGTRAPASAPRPTT
jgi:UPF0716 protein FxsA